MTSPPWFPLRTERLILRPFRKGDLADLHDLASDPVVVRFMDWGPNTPDETSSRLAMQLEEQTTWPRSEVNLAVEHLEDARLIGTIRLSVQPHQNADFGYVLARPFWGLGLGCEAARAIVDVAFDDLGLHRLWATCDARNQASVRLLKKLGLRLEGTLLKNQLVRDGWRDTCVFAILREEWKRRRV